MVLCASPSITRHIFLLFVYHIVVGIIRAQEYSYDDYSGNVDCDTCLSMFEEAGGCDCMKNNCNNVTALIPDGCYSCGDKAEEYCNSPNNDTDEVSGYVYYKERGCDGRNELFTGSVGSRNECSTKCNDNIDCISFEWWGEANPHPQGPNHCHLSSSCTYELSTETNIGSASPDRSDLYVRECIPLSQNTGRCGPNWGGRCNKKLVDYAVYCNVDNGWCGNTEEHKNAQPSDEYDWIPSTCQEVEHTDESKDSDCVDGKSWCHLADCGLNHVKRVCKKTCGRC